MVLLWCVAVLLSLTKGQGDISHFYLAQVEVLKELKRKIKIKIKEENIKIMSNSK